MTVASTINLITIFFCGAVLVQCWRMRIALDRFRSTDLPGMVTALERSTHEAEGVLRRIRALLATEAEPKLLTLSEASRVADELGVMIGIANASADRLLEAARDSRPADRDMAA